MNTLRRMLPQDQCDLQGVPSRRRHAWSEVWLLPRSCTHMEDDRKWNHSHNENKPSRRSWFLTGTAHRQHDTVAKARSLATLSLLSWYSLDSLDTKRESTELFFNRFIFFLCNKKVIKNDYYDTYERVVLVCIFFYWFHCFLVSRMCCKVKCLLCSLSSPLEGK